MRARGSGLPRLAVAVGAALALLPALAPAQAPQSPSTRIPARPPAEPIQVIGLVDIGLVLRGSSATQSLQQQIQTEQDRYQSAFDAEQRQLREAEETIERERGSLSSDAYAERRRAFQERLNKVASDFRLRRRQLEEAFAAANSQITKTLSAVIEELAIKNGVSIIIRREAVLFQRNAVDLTEAALALLNEKLPRVDVSVPAAPP